MLNEQKGGSYPWVNATWNPLGGQFPYNCNFLDMKHGQMKLLPKYQRQPFLAKEELKTNLYACARHKGPMKVFVCNCTDMFSEPVSDDWISSILNHCNKFPENTYLFMSKNPVRFFDFEFPPHTILGTTIETNKGEFCGDITPHPDERVVGIYHAQSALAEEAKWMVSIEPIMHMDVGVVTRWIKGIEPDFVSIGAGSERLNLPEPIPETIQKLISKLEKFTEVLLKDNLKRLLFHQRNQRKSQKKRNKNERHITHARNRRTLHPQ